MEQKKTFTEEEFKRLVKNDFYQSLDSTSQLFIGDIHFHAASTYKGETLLNKNPDLENAYTFAFNALKENQNKVKYQNEEYDILPSKPAGGYSSSNNNSFNIKKSERVMRDSNIEIMTYARTILNALDNIDEIVENHQDVEFYDSYIRDISESMKRFSSKLIERLDNKNKNM